MFTTITNLPNAIITTDVNAHSPLWYLPIKDHRGELIEDILHNSNHITLNTNTPTCLSPNHIQQPNNLLYQTSPLLQQTCMIALACRSSTPLHQITYLYSPSSVYITRLKKLTFTSPKQ